MIENESLFRLVTLQEDELLDQQQQNADQVQPKTLDDDDGNGHGKVTQNDEVGPGAAYEDYDSEYEPEIEKKLKKKNRRKPIATKVNINKTPGPTSGEKRRAGPQRMFERESDIEINRRLTEYDWEKDATKTTAKGITKFKCRTCNATIVTKSGLFYHMMLHTGERPYVCKYEGCGAAYPQPAGRLVHENSHTKTKKFKYEDVDQKDQKSSTMKKGSMDVQLDLASSRTLKKLRLSQNIKNWALVDEEKAKRKYNKSLMKAAGITPESTKTKKSKSKEIIQTPPFKFINNDNSSEAQKVIELDTSPILNLLKKMQPNLSYNSDDQISFLIQDFDLNVKSKFGEAESEESGERDFKEERDPLALDLPDKKEDKIPELSMNEEKVITEEGKFIKKELYETENVEKMMENEEKVMEDEEKIVENEEKKKMTENEEKLMTNEDSVLMKTEEELQSPTASVFEGESMDINVKNEEIEKEKPAEIVQDQDKNEIESDEIETMRSGPETYLNESDEEDNEEEGNNGTRHDDNDLEHCFDNTPPELFQEPEMPDLEIEDPDPADEMPSNSNVRKSGRKRTISVKMREKYNLSPSPSPPVVKRTPKMNKSRVPVREKAKKELKQNEMSMPSTSSSFEMEQTLNPIILKMNKRRRGKNIPPQDRDQKMNILNNNMATKVNKRSRVNSYNSDTEYDWTVDFVRVKNPALPTKFECRHCKKTIGKAYLRSHKYTHTGEKPFSCPYDECVRRFRANEELRRHLRVHTGEKPYPCRFPKCDQSFRLFDSRKNHELLHTPGMIKPYSCSVCLKRFARKDYKQNHERVYHPSNRKDTTRVKVNANPSTTTSNAYSSRSGPTNIKFSSLKSLNNSASTGVSVKTKRQQQYIRSKQRRQDKDSWVAPRVDHRLMVMNKYRTTSKRRAEKNQQRILKEEEEEEEDIVIKYENSIGDTYIPEEERESEETEKSPEPSACEKSVTKIIAIVFSESTDFEGDPMLITNELEVPTTNNTNTEHY